MQTILKHATYFLFMDIAMRIRSLRKSRGLTQVDLAQKLGTSQKVICDYEKGHAKPSSTRLPALATILGTTVDNLLGTETAVTQTDDNGNHVHGNSRAAKIQELFDKLNPADQRAVLKHVTGLLAQYGNNGNGRHTTEEE
jgi:transcriptional regulator with XRE-family HTH domain